MPKGDKFQDLTVKKDDIEYPAWQRSRHSSQEAVKSFTRAGKPLAWRRAAGCLIDKTWRYAECKTLKLYYQC